MFLFTVKDCLSTNLEPRRGRWWPFAWCSVQRPCGARIWNLCDASAKPSILPNTLPSCISSRLPCGPPTRISVMLLPSRYSWGRATLVLAQNCSSAIVALDFPRNRPCGYSSAVLGLIQLQIPVDLVSLRCNLQHLKTYIYLISLSIPYRI